MNIPMASSAMRFFLSVVSTILWAGIYFTGFEITHWLIYIPATFFAFAAITGICPGMIFSNMLFKSSNTQKSPD